MHRNQQNRNMGEWFEKQLDAYHAELHRQGKAEVYRTQPAVRLTGHNRAVVVGRGPVDYIAFLANGRTVHFDAKTRQAGDEDAFSTGSDMAHQITWLRRRQQEGHTSGLLVFWWDIGECRWHPIENFDKRVRRREGLCVEGFAWLDLLASPIVR